MSLESKTALITGAGSGIGRELAIAAARRGLMLALCGRREAALRETASLLPGTANHLILAADVTLPASRAGIVARLTRDWAHLDFLVNNAGLVQAGAIEATCDDELSALFAVNVLAPMALSRDLLPLLKAASPARIVNVGSMFGDIAYPMFTAYSASKFALRGFSNGLRRELRPYGVGVTYASPKATDTPAAARIGNLVKSLQPNLEQPRRVAEEIWSAAERGSNTVYPRGADRLFVFAERLFSGVVDAAVARQLPQLMSIEKAKPGEFE